MESTFNWLQVGLTSTVLLWVPALVLALIFVGIGLVYGWGWRALYLLPIGPLLVAMGWAAWGMGLPTVPTAAPAGALRVAHLNALYHRAYPVEAKAAFVKNSIAEVVSVVEANPELRVRLREISGTYPYTLHTKGPLPMVLLAQHPITRAQGWSERMVLYHIAKPGMPFYVLQLHPQSPHSAASLAVRTAHLAKLAEVLPTLPRPLLVVGDMNTVPWDEGLAPVHAALTQAGEWRRWLPTFHAQVPVTPIDALYYSSAFKGATLQHIRVPNSDHLGLVVDLITS